MGVERDEELGRTTGRVFPFTLGLGERASLAAISITETVITFNRSTAPNRPEGIPGCIAVLRWGRNCWLSIDLFHL